MKLRITVSPIEIDFVMDAELTAVVDTVVGNVAKATPVEETPAVAEEKPAPKKKATRKKPAKKAEPAPEPEAKAEVVEDVPHDKKLVALQTWLAETCKKYVPLGTSVEGKDYSKLTDELVESVRSQECKGVTALTEETLPLVVAGIKKVMYSDRYDLVEHYETTFPCKA